MPGKDTRKEEALDHRLKVGLTVAEANALAHLADAAGLTQAGYVRQLIRQALGTGPALQARRHRDAWHRLTEVHELAVQIRKLGASLAELARQLDANLLPEMHASLVTLHHGVEGAMVKAVTLFDAILTDVEPNRVEP